jgi:site-specific recombinase XerD
MVTNAAPDTGPEPMVPRLRELIEQYRVSNAVEGKSPKTVGWYTALLTAFRAYLDRSGLPDELLVFTLSTARSYVLDLQQRNRLSRYTGSAPARLSPKTVQCHVRTLKAFSSWLFREGLTSENHLANLKIPRAPSKMFDPLAPAETNKVFGSINRKTPIGMRNHAIFALMMDTGFRASEACSSQLPHLNLEKHWLKVMGKGAKERLLPFGDYARADLYHYLKNGRPRLAGKSHCQVIFLNADGSPMTYNALKLMFNRLAKASGISRLHPHLCRHTFAINYLLNGGDVFSLKEILGHTTLDMVNAYLHFTTAQIAVQHHKYSPMDRLKGKSNGSGKPDASKDDF